jgi:hypothetical protein
MAENFVFTINRFASDFVKSILFGNVCHYHSIKTIKKYFFKMADIFKMVTDNILVINKAINFQLILAFKSFLETHSLCLSIKIIKNKYMFSRWRPKMLKLLCVNPLSTGGCRWWSKNI